MILSFWEYHKTKNILYKTYKRNVSARDVKSINEEWQKVHNGTTIALELKDISSYLLNNCEIEDSIFSKEKISLEEFLELC